MATPSGLKRDEPDDQRSEARFIASIDAGIADADADDLMGTDELERWLAARRRVATPETPR